MLSDDMRIGVDASCWSNRRGYGRFTRELVGALLRNDAENEYWLFADHRTADRHEFPIGAHLVPVSTTLPPTEAASASGRRSFRDVWAMTSSVRKHKLDLFFFPASYSYFPILNRTRILLTIHDMIASLHARDVFENKKLERFWKLKHALAIRQADRILTVSQHSKRQIMEGYSVPDSKVSVVPEGPGSVFRKVEMGQEIVRTLRRFEIKTDAPYLLYAGGISPHKNLRRLVDAFSVLLKSHASLQLVLVGDYESDSFYSDYPFLSNQVRELGVQDRVIFTGFVDDEELVHLYNAARVFVFPSLQEGFGLPAVEAMACGTPVVASREGSLPEIVGDSGYYFDPCSTDDLVASVSQVLGDPALQEQMRLKGLERVKQFEWDRASKVTLTIFREMYRKF